MLKQRVRLAHLLGGNRKRRFWGWLDTPHRPIVSVFPGALNRVHDNRFFGYVVLMHEPLQVLQHRVAHHSVGLIPELGVIAVHDLRRLQCSSMSRPPSYCVECVAHRDGFGLYGAREREMIVLLVHHVVLGQVLTDRPSLRGRWRCGSMRVSRRAFRARLAAVVPLFTEVWTAHGWGPV